MVRSASHISESGGGAARPHRPGVCTRRTIAPERVAHVHSAPPIYQAGQGDARSAHMKNCNPPFEIMSPKEAAEYVGRSVSTLREWRKAGAGPPWITARRRWMDAETA